MVHSSERRTTRVAHAIRATRRIAWLVPLVVFAGGGLCNDSPSAPPVQYTVAVAGGGTGDGSISSSVGGVSCTVTHGVASGACSATLKSGSAITLTPAPANGSTFGGWSGACSGTGTCALEVTQSQNVMATFVAPIVTLTVTGAGTGNGVVTSSPAGISCNIAGASPGGTCTAQFPAGTSVSLTAAPSAGGNTFTGWSGACTGTGACTLVLSQSQSVAASFAAAAQTLAVSGAGGGSGSITSNPAGITCTIASGAASGSCQSTFAFGTVVTLSASPSPTNTFTAWGGACAGSTPCQVTLNQARAVTATFTPASFTVAVLGSGTGAGKVASNAGDIDCTIASGATSGTCSTSVAPGTAMALTATPNANSKFAAWSGACSGTGTCQLNVTQNVTVTAAMAVVATFGLTVSANGSGSGSISSAPAGISCQASNGAANGTCQASFADGTVVTLTATPGGGASFGGWSGACTGTGTCQVTMSQARAVTATFSAPAQALVVTAAGTGSGDVTSNPAAITCSMAAGVASGTCQSSFGFGTVVALSAAPSSGSTFSGWTGACTGTGACQVTMSQARSVSAAFAAAGPATVTVQMNITTNVSTSAAMSLVGSGVNCAATTPNSNTCTYSVPVGTVLNVTLSWTAAGWYLPAGGPGYSGMTCQPIAAGATSRSCSVTVGGSMTISATL